MSTMHQLNPGPKGLRTYEYETRPADQLSDRAALERRGRSLITTQAAAPFPLGAQALTDSVAYVLATTRHRRAPTGQGVPS